MSLSKKRAINWLHFQRMNFIAEKLQESQPEGCDNIRAKIAELQIEAAIVFPEIAPRGINHSISSPTRKLLGLKT